MAVLLAFIIAIKNPASNTQCQTMSILLCRGLQSPRNDLDPEMVPNREMIPKSTISIRPNHLVDFAPSLLG